MDVQLGQLAYVGHSMLTCGVAPSEVRSLLRKCSTLAMEIPPPDLDALMATLNSFGMRPRSFSLRVHPSPPSTAVCSSAPSPAASIATSFGTAGLPESLLSESEGRGWGGREDVGNTVAGIGD
ncbi:unnamed protein product, partial [Discosporangium mesarthrocarpum]